MFGHGTTPTRETGAIDLTITASTIGGWQVLSVAGELDLATSSTLARRLDEVTDGSAVALDLRDVAFIDSTGLSTVIAGANRARERDGRFAVVATDDGPVQRIITLTGLDQLVDVVRSADDLDD